MISSPSQAPLIIAPCTPPAPGEEGEEAAEEAAEAGEEGDDAVAAAAALVARLTSQVAALEGEVGRGKGSVAACTGALEVQQAALAAVNKVRGGIAACAGLCCLDAWCGFL
jgi:hypothetical protein